MPTRNPRKPCVVAEALHDAFATNDRINRHRVEHLDELGMWDRSKRSRG